MSSLTNHRSRHNCRSVIGYLLAEVNRVFPEFEEYLQEFDKVIGQKIRSYNPAVNAEVMNKHLSMAADAGDMITRLHAL